MGVIFRNMYVNVTDMNGISKYKNKYVQIDDAKSTAQVFIDRIPLIQKVLYDLPSTVPVPYARGDVVTITSIGKYATQPEDNVFWVQRAQPVGGPLAGWEVGLVGGRVTNATVSTTRLNKLKSEQVPMEKNIRITYMPPTAEMMEAWGSQITTVLLFDPFYDVSEGDIIKIKSIDGIRGVDSVEEYTAKDVVRFPTPVPHIHVEIEGVFQ